MKLSGLTFFLIGLSVALIALSYAWFYHGAPNMQMAENDRNLEAALDVEIGKERQAKKRVEEAKKLVDERTAKWRETVLARTPAPSVEGGGINLAVNAWQLTVDSQRFRNNIQRAVNRQVKIGGVRVINGPAIPSPEMEATSILADYYNYPVLKFPVVIFDLGQVTVQGTYKQITDNVRAWSTMPNYLAVASGLQITGTSPNLTGTYSLTIVGYIRATEVFPPVPEGAAGATQPGQTPGGGGQQPTNVPEGGPKKGRRI